MMDNSHSPTPDQSHMSVTLSAAQYGFYQNTYLELLTPEGQHLDYMGKALRLEQQAREEDQTYRLRDQVALVACLLSNVQDEIHLPLPAVLGLTELFLNMQEEWKRR